MFYLRFKKIFLNKLVNHSFLLISSFFVSDVSESLISLRSNEPCEWIAHFAHQKWGTMSNLLKSLRENEDCERIAHFAHQKWANEWFAHSLIFWGKNEWFARKSNERIPSPVWVPLKSDCNIWRFPAILLMYSALIWTGRFKLAFTTCILMYSAHCRQPWETSQTDQDDDQELAKRRRERESHRG